MNAVPHTLNEDINTRSGASDASVDVEPSNIISLSEQGLLLRSPDSNLAEEDFNYHQYSPLNEW